MGTRSRVGIMHGTVCKSVYCHYDGYTSTAIAAKKMSAGRLHTHSKSSSSRSKAAVVNTTT